MAIPLMRPKSLPWMVFLLVRVPLLLALPFDGLRGYGDFYHFYRLAQLPGLPFVNYWVEFPPLFPFLLEGLVHLAPRENAFTYLLVILLTGVDVASIVLFQRLTEHLSLPDGDTRAVLYAALIAGLAYTWWYFDSLCVFFTLLGLHALLSSRSDAQTGVIIGLGMLTKWFPALVLPTIWRSAPPRRAITITLTALGLVAAVYGSLWLVSPEFTRASLQSQSAKGSWETVWALLDGNWGTGNFGDLALRFDPQAAVQPMGNPERIPAWIRLLGIGGLGFILYLRHPVASPKNSLTLVGLTWALFFLWSPGWSPQWVLYLIPLILLSLPLRQGLLMSGTLTLVNLLEWPLLLSRGWFQWLALPVGLRTFLLILLVVVWVKHSRATSLPSNPY
ncbi:MULTISPECIES: hypothetical protein [Anaerolinea]|uniref:hypothetical protein n=1 Tax=Anaerolinea TaxID=233189 RepID=UPI002602FE29|nr:hypothetical protein [Anaerolinea thermophila]